MRILRVVAALVVAAGLVATPSTGVVEKASTFDLGPSANANGTGPLANFKGKGGNRVRLLAGAFDPAAGSLPAGSGIGLRDRSTLRVDTPQYWLVQVRDQRYADVVSAVSKAGGQIAGTVPDATYMVRATPAQRDEIASNSAVRWAGYYQPAWRMPVAAAGKPGLLELTGKQRYRVHVFTDDPARGAVARALSQMDGVKVLQDAGVVVDVQATKAELPAIAALPAVEWIGTPPRIVPHNMNARWVNDTGVRDLYAATAPGRLNGAGQTAGVADTGVNYKLDLNGRAHVNFRDCDAAGVCKEAIYTQVAPGNTPAQMENVQNNATGHRKMVAYFDLGSAGPNMFDESSHGTHTAGSVDGDKPPYGTWQGADGMAPAAMHVHQNIATTSGGLGGLPADEYNMFRQAYRPRNPAGVPTGSPPNGNVADYSNYVATEDARTHNNSWGAIYDVADDGTAVRFDRFVWDHEDMVITVSAGNAGPAAFTIGSPSVAKNDLSSGASANGRQPMVSIDSMAAFSSHGPTGDLRYGTDLATPGQIVVSSKGGTVDDEHTAQGTSMSSPVLNGLAVLVRQYFYDGYGAAAGKGFAGGSANLARRHNPSAALVKASLLNGAERMRGWYSGDDGQVRGLDGQWPSAGQGYGRVNLDNSLYFSSDPTNNWYQDVWRGDAAAFGAGVGATRTYTVNVQPGSPLDVTLAWTDAPNTLPAGTPALVNNLDLTVTGPGGTYVGNNFNSRATPGVAVAETPAGPGAPDAANPNERIRIANPAAGAYTITVTGTSVMQGMQGFALAASGRISAVGSSFTPGPARQRDLSGTPTISNVKVDPISSNTAVVRFTTNEPTTATATAGGNTYIDSYNVGSGGFPGLNEGTVETSAEYGDKPVVGTSHEILMTALSAGQTYSIALAARDLASNTRNASVTHTSPALAYQADAPDIGYFSSGPNGAANWRTGTQMYAGTAFVDPLGAVAQRHLGAWMFRIPETAIDPNAITGAVVETTSRHNWVVQYTADPQFTVDLLNESVEPNWGTQNYDAIRSAPHTARVFPETGYERGGGQRYAFTFNCSDLAALRSSLSTVAGGQRKAAFRYEATQTDDASLFAMDFGFNRRSSGPEYRPRLLLFTGTSYPTGEGCDPNAPAPVINDVGIQDGLTDGSVTVTWRTDNVSSDSMVLFREQGTTQWTQVGTPARTRVHQVQVHGLDSSNVYEFVVRSRACNGATATDTNNGAGYDFFRHAPDPGPRTQHGSTIDFETGAEGWTVTSSSQDQAGNESRWTLGPSGDGSTNGWHVAHSVTGAHAYFNFNETTLTSPTPVAFTGGLASVEFSLALDSEPTFDFLYVEYSPTGVDPWTEAAHFDGYNGHPAYSPTDARFANPGGPVFVRFRFKSDELLSFPLYLGASIDRVTYASYPNAPPEDTENLPLTGPVPPPSARATGLSAPATRGGPASAADIAAGTGACVVAAMRPDLRVGNLVPSDNQPREGKRVTITATVTNSGDLGAAASQTEITRDGTVVLGRINTPALAPGQSANVSVEWDTQHQQGQHLIRATADWNNTVAESDEANNFREITVTVRGNRVRNGDFEIAGDNAQPAQWQEEDDAQGRAGHNSWSQGGSHGAHSASSTGNGGNAALAGSPTWTSDAIAVTPGETLELVTSVRSTALSSAPSAGLVYLGSLGEVIRTVQLITAPLSTVGFTTLEQTVTLPAGVAHVRVVLTGFAATDTATNGTVTFDDVGLFGL
jgi:CARDB protein